MKNSVHTAYAAVQLKCLVSAYLIAICAAVSSANIYTVVNTNASGAGSLYQAILDANANPGHDEIRFNIAPAGPHTIFPTGQYPAITSAVLIDGTTQPGYSNAPVIEIDGSSSGGSVVSECFLIQAGTSTVRSLCINSFGRSAIRIETNGFNAVEGCFLGADLTGTQRKQNVLHGIMVLSSDNNRFGGTTPMQANLLSGNVSHGIIVAAAIGGAPSTNNVIKGNYIGTDISGTVALTNGTGVAVNGSHHTIGGAEPNAGNLISGNTGTGLRIEAAHSCVVQGNFIGTDISGAVAITNGGHGVEIRNASSNLVGGASAGEGNLVSGNRLNGIYLLSSVAGLHGSNVIQGNLVGTDITGTSAIGNGADGIFISLMQGTLVGSTIPAGGNVLSGNGNNGISVAGTNTDVIGNFIGVDVNGTSALGNTIHGAHLFQPNIRIGGTGDGEGNVISGNGFDGILMENSAHHCRIQGNIVGLDVTGTAGIGNGRDGIIVFEVLGNLIGGDTPAAGNIFSKNGREGIHLLSFVSFAFTNTVMGNYVGTDITGTLPLGNVSRGVVVEGIEGCTIGGGGPGEGNLISGNGEHGIWILSSAESNTIRGNLIGTDISGVSALGNGFDGIRIDDASYNLIGGSGPGEGNVVSGNFDEGMEIQGSGTRGTVVQGNHIGVSIYGADPLPNLGNGIDLDDAAFGNVIGGTAEGEGNRIAYSGVDGVRVRDGSVSNRITGNAIYGNGELGIDLGSDGAAINDAGDVDGGDNFGQNYPEITNVISGSTVIQGTLNSAASTSFQLEFFSTEDCDASGYGEGRYFLGFTSVATDGGGNAAFSFTSALTVADGHAVSATATDPSGNTSEFSPCFTVTVPDSDGDGIPDAWETSHGLNPAVSNAPSDDADSDGVFDIDEFFADTHPTNGMDYLVITGLEQSGGRVVTFPTSDERVYDLRWSSNIVDGVWFIITPDIMGDGTPVSVLDPSGDDAAIYSVRVKQP